MQRASVNLHKTNDAYEMLVFAPGRIKKHFKFDVQGKELSISYTLPEGFARPQWVLREYSRGGFTRTFILEDNIDTDSIKARYEDGVLYVTLPLLAGNKTNRTQITNG